MQMTIIRLIFDVMDNNDNERKKRKRTDYKAYVIRPHYN